MKSAIRLHPVVSAILLMALCLIPVMALKDISPSNELRYLSIADEAIENGNVFAFSNHGEPYADKPPLYFWLLMLSRLVFGEHNIFVLNLFSFIPAVVTIAVMDRWLMQTGRQASLKFSDGERFAAAMMLGTSAMYLGTAVILRMDMLMTMFIVLSLYTFYKMYRGIGNARMNGILLPVYIFLALFTKGPVGLLMPLAGIFFFLLFSGKLRTAGKYLGLRTWGILVLLCGLWFLGVWLDGGKEYLNNLLFHQTFDRAVDAFHHKKPVWYYLTAIWYVAAPFSTVMVYSLFSRAGRAYVTDAGRLFFVSALATFIMLSAFSSKLAVYLLPVLPFMAYFTILAGKNIGKNGWMRVLTGIPVFLLMAVSAAMIFLPLILHYVPQLSLPEEFSSLSRSLWLYAAGAALLTGSVLSAKAIFSRNVPWTTPISAQSVSLLLAILLLSPLVPRLNGYIGYRNLSCVARDLKEISGVSGYATVDVSRPENMDVYLGEDVKILDRDSVEGLSDTVLMIRTSSVDSVPALGDRLSGLHPVHVGPYTVFVLMPDRRPAAGDVSSTDSGGSASQPSLHR